MTEFMIYVCGISMLLLIAGIIEDNVIPYIKKAGDDNE